MLRESYEPPTIRGLANMAHKLRQAGVKPFGAVVFPPVLAQIQREADPYFYVSVDGEKFVLITLRARKPYRKPVEILVAARRECPPKTAYMFNRADFYAKLQEMR